MILNNVTDAYTSQASATKNYASADAIGLRTGSGVSAYGWMKLTSSLNLPPSAALTLGKIRLYNRDAWSGSRTLTIELVTTAWDVSKLTWAKSPTVTVVGAVSVTKSSPAKGAEWLFDVLPLVAGPIAAGTFYGLRVRTSSTVREYLTSTESRIGNKPTFEFEWTTAPATPAALNPSQARAVSLARPTFQFDYRDASIGSAMAAYQLQLNYGSASFVSPSFDSGTVASSRPEHTFTTDLTPDTSFFWRVRVKSATEWSDWSAPAESIRKAKGVVTITAPAESPLNIVAEYTPPKAWTFSGTQAAYQVIDTDSANTSIVYADSLRQPGTASTYSSPVPQVFTGGLARTVVRVWDNIARADTPGDPSYSVAARTFTLEYESSVSPVTNFSAVPSASTPVVALTFDRSTAPDSFTILRDGLPWQVGLEPGDLLTSATHYAYIDTTASPRTPHTYTVVAVVNNVGASDSPTQTVSIEPMYIWILDERDPSWSVALAGQEGGAWGLGEQSQMIEIIGGDRLLLQSQAMRGYEGSVSGGLYSSLPGVSGLTAQEMRARVWDMKRNPTRIYRLVLSDINIPVIVRNVNVAPTPHAELDYQVSLEFYQQGELPWAV